MGKGKVFSLDRNRAEAFIRDVNGRLQNLQQGLTNGEVNFNRTWNVVNVLIRMFMNQGIARGWWSSKAEFMKDFQLASGELLAEAKAHQQEELERIKREQREGQEPSPMKPFDGNMVAKCADTIDDVKEASRESEDSAKEKYGKPEEGKSN